MNWLNNICLLTDSYKVSHHRQYPPQTTRVYSYFESRSGAAYPQTVFFGLQYWLKQYLAGQVVTREKIDQAEKLFKSHFATPVFNRAGWEHILREHKGRIPVEIKAVPEGTLRYSEGIVTGCDCTAHAARRVKTGVLHCHVCRRLSGRVQVSARACRPTLPYRW